MMRALSNFQQRFLMSLLGIIILIIVLASSHTWPFQFLFIATLAYVQAVALMEYYALAKTKGLHPNRTLGAIFSVLYIFAHYFSRELFLPVFLFLALSFLFHFFTHKQAIANLAATFFGFCYITLPLSLTIDINFLPYGTSSCFWIVYLLVTTKMTDTAAYFSGKLFGKHLLTPLLSPKKTKEGALGGILGAVASSVLFYIFSPVMQQLVSSAVGAVILGCVLGVIAEIGDLAESLLKRDANVKDSSELPGFGGMLDVVDSLLFTAPLLYFWLYAL
jgi:phosphatidate cytidylyltransferase